MQGSASKQALPHGREKSLLRLYTNSEAKMELLSKLSDTIELLVGTE